MNQKKSPQFSYSIKKGFKSVKVLKLSNAKIYETHDVEGGMIRLKFRKVIPKAEALIRNILYSKPFQIKKA